MKSLTRHVAQAIGALALAMLSYGTAYGTNGFPTFDTTIAGFEEAAVVLGDKRFTFVEAGGDLAGTTGLSFLYDNAGSYFVFIVSPGGETGYLGYSVDILAPGNIFGAVALASALPLEEPEDPITASVTKTLYSSTTSTASIAALTSSNGAPTGLLDLSPLKLTTLYIVDSYNVSEPDALMGIRNTIVQTTVPEPATVALFGLGLAGIGAMRRKYLAA